MEFLHYDIEVAVLVAVFYMFYRLLLSRENLHRLNRVVLIGTAVASFVLPLCVITVHRTELLPAMTTMTDTPVRAVSTATESTPWWKIALPAVFWAGVIVNILLTVISIIKVSMLIHRCEKHRQDDGTVIAVSDDNVSPFSWMRYIVLSRSDYGHIDEAILIHERAHVRLHHSLDVLFVDILSSLQWFNPAMWMLRSDLRAVHEYEADAAVLSSGVNARQYQYLLVSKALASGGYSVANSFSHSTLKQRITMMQNKNTNRHAWLRALYVVPVIAVSLYASARTVVDYKVMPAKGQTEAISTASSTQASVPALNATASTDEAQAAQTVEQIIEQKDSAGNVKANVLIVIDGKAATQKELETLKPDDIESINIKKDAQSLAKYKAVGKNTVIEVVTKAGGENAGGATRPDAQVAPEEMPKFPGNINVYLAQNMQYPKAAIANNVQGRVVVRFIVNTDGHVSDASVVNCSARIAAPAAGNGKAGKKLSKSEQQKALAEGKAALEGEALRIVNSMPAWTPGTNNGKPASVWYYVPITFAMN